MVFLVMHLVSRIHLEIGVLLKITAIHEILCSCIDVLKNFCSKIFVIARKIISQYRGEMFF